MDTNLRNVSSVLQRLGVAPNIPAIQRALDDYVLRETDIKAINEFSRELAVYGKPLYHPVSLPGIEERVIELAISSGRIQNKSLLTPQVIELAISMRHIPDISSILALPHYSGGRFEGDGPIKLKKDIDNLELLRMLFRPSMLDRHGEAVRGLIRQKEITDELFKNAELYRQTACDVFQLPSDEHLSRQQFLSRMLESHPHILRTHVSYSIPLALLMELTNRSKFGIYTNGNAKVTPSDKSLEATFITLAFCSYWRRMMGRWAVKMAQRFKQSGAEDFNLIMVGDGTGQLGASMTQALQRKGIKHRLVHIDIGENLLLQQREAYMRTGINHDDVISINGSILDAPTLLAANVPDFKGGFFVLHEVIDALRSHSLVVSPSETKELYYEVGNGSSGTIAPYNVSNPHLKRCSNYFGFYRDPSHTRFLPFSVEYLLAIKAIMESAPHVAAYIGDYSSQFTWGTFDKVPLRVYGGNRETSFDYTNILDSEAFVDTTVDVDPSIIYLAEAFGGKVEFLGPQENFLTEVDPMLTDRLQVELRRIGNKTLKGYRADEEMAFWEDYAFYQIASPSMFAAIATKNI